MQGNARRGKARYGKVKKILLWLGLARSGTARRGRAEQGMARRGWVEQGMARLKDFIMARSGKARWRYVR
jgi:hypothetical protein